MSDGNFTIALSRMPPDMREAYLAALDHAIRCKARFHVMEDRGDEDESDRWFERWQSVTRELKRARSWTQRQTPSTRAAVVRGLRSVSGPQLVRLAS